MEYNAVTKTLLRKMLMHNVCGGKHHGLVDLQRGVPSHDKGNVEKAIKKLVKDNLVLRHPTSYGFQYSLNHDRIDDIHDLLEPKS